jgi:hypothetical protein
LAEKEFISDRLLAARNWQPRPQLDELIEWYRSCTSPGQNAGSIAALVGIGGAGKTAIVERFTWTIPGIRPRRPDIVAKPDLRPPATSLTFSFYTKPRAELFFAALDGWLGKTVAKKARASAEIVDRLKKKLAKLPVDSHVVLILDGLERIQDTAHSNTLGKISDETLTRLFDDIADGDPAFSSVPSAII